MDTEQNKATAAVLQWWRALHLDIGGAHASRARLRRCSGALAALLLEETHDLIKMVRRADESSATREVERRLVVLATILPLVELQSRTPLARALGQTSDGRIPNGDERPRLSPARFGTLTRAARARNWDGFARSLRRALAILSKTPFDVARLIDDILFMNGGTLQRWTYEYWQTRAPADRSDIEPDDSPANKMEATP
jgi:CRISPR type I-E-associated protein CasB/Cse2